MRNGTSSANTTSMPGDDRQRGAACVVAHEGELDHPGGDHVGEQRPATDAHERVPRESDDPGDHHEADEQQHRRDDQHHGRQARAAAGSVHARPNHTPPTTTAASDTVTTSTAFGNSLLGAHSVATLVMITSVATCMTPVMPAV